MFRGECPMFRNIYTVYITGKHCPKFIFMNMSQIITLELKAGTESSNGQLNAQILHRQFKSLAFHRSC